MPTIYLENRGAYRPAVEDVTREGLFFAPAYRQARDCLRSIVENSLSFAGDPRALNQYPNNILAFCADRGHGKTSAMLSFSGALQNMGEAALGFWGGKTRESRFFVLDPIDPTALEQTDSAIRILLARMFQAVTEAAEGRPASEQEKAGRRKLLARFQTCFRLADKQKAREHHNDDYDDLYRLTEMGDSTNLKMELNLLVGDFLSYLLAGTVDAAPGGRFLVVQIDDADMNTTNAYEVVEDIRKYCMLPNVLVLLSVNMGLLEQTVENYFLGAHKHIVGSGTGDTALWSRKRCHETAVNYLDKLVPGRHRIDLPDIDREMGNPWNPLQLCISGETGEYQRVLLEVLQEKCLFSLPEREMELHPFLPKRMRELVHFADLLLGMESPGITRRALLAWAQNGGTEAAQRQVQVLESNLGALTDYFLYHWCETRLDHQQRWALEAIHQARTEQKVERAVEALGRLIPEAEQKKIKEEFTPWQKLGRHVEYFRARGQRDFAAGVELMFHLYRDVLMVQDCIGWEQRRNDHE